MSEPVIGIDLGTTFSAVATVEGKKPVIIRNRTGGRLTPSVVGFTPRGERVVGEKAHLLSDAFPDNVAWATKRYIGRRWTAELAASARAVVPYSLIPGPSNEIRIKLAGRTLPVTQISAMILGELKLDAQAFFGKPVSKAVITVPANFDDGQRAATKEAARIAGLDVLRIINEPTAAAVAYGLSSGFQGQALVFDLGGGTFDVSILEVQEGVFQVKATGGDPLLGGEDFDNRIVQWLLAQVPDELRDAVVRDKLSLRRLKVAAERAKRELTDRDEAAINVADLGDHSPAGNRRFIDIDTALTRGFFHSLSEPLSRRCLDVCERVLAEAKLATKDIEAVLLVGGMTKVPLIRSLVAEYFQKQPVTGLNPDEVVALGAAVHAGEIGGQLRKALLLDVASHSLGVGVLGGGVRRLISKNTPIPVVAKEVFLPSQAGQRDVRIPIYQGEANKAEENTKLGEVTLRDLEVIARADVPIEVSFELSSEGTLSVRAMDTTTGLAEAIRVESRTELASHEVEKLRREQESYASDQGEKDQETAVASFNQVLEKAEKLRTLLTRSAEENNSSSEAKAAVELVDSLLTNGRAALDARDVTQMAEISRTIERLVAAR